QTKNDLGAATWADLPGVVLATDAVAAMSFTVSAEPQRFFRVVRLPSSQIVHRRLRMSPSHARGCAEVQHRRCKRGRERANPASRISALPLLEGEGRGEGGRSPNLHYSTTTR